MRATLPLLAALAALAAAPAAAQAPPPPRPPVVLEAPAPGETVAAAPAGRRRLTAVVLLSGTAEPRQHVRLSGACGRTVCDGVTFANSRGRWLTRLRLTTPRRRRTVVLTLAYADPRPGEAPVRARIRLAKPPAELPAAPAAAHAQEPTDPSPRALLVLGDSLALGTFPHLGALLPGWPVYTDARVGRPLAEGMQMLADLRLPGARGGERTVVAFSLFTNDPPQDLPALEAAVRQSVERVGAGGCAVWATIARPRVGGLAYDEVNARLRALARDPALGGRLIVVRWAEAVRRHRRWLGDDRVHATPAGYVARAEMYAEAAQTCPS